jgi:hypothetical protein
LGLSNGEVSSKKKDSRVRTVVEELRTVAQTIEESLTLERAASDEWNAQRRLARGLLDLAEKGETLISEAGDLTDLPIQVRAEIIEKVSQLIGLSRLLAREISHLAPNVRSGSISEIVA